MSDTMRRSGDSTRTKDPFRRRSKAGRSPATRFEVLAVISAGGALGASARYAIGLAVPHSGAGFPWSTFAVNATGCLVVGAFMVAITEVFAAHRLLRPFVGVGLLGGYTTFSTYTADGIQLARSGDYRLALVYIAATMLAAMLATVLGAFGARGMFQWAGRAKGAH